MEPEHLSWIYRSPTGASERPGAGQAQRAEVPPGAVIYRLERGDSSSFTSSLRNHPGHVAEEREQGVSRGGVAGGGVRQVCRLIRPAGGSTPAGCSPRRRRRFLRKCARHYSSCTCSKYANFQACSKCLGVYLLHQFYQVHFRPDLCGPGYPEGYATSASNTRDNSIKYILSSKYKLQKFTRSYLRRLKNAVTLTFSFLFLS